MIDDFLLTAIRAMRALLLLIRLVRGFVKLCADRRVRNQLQRVRNGYRWVVTRITAVLDCNLIRKTQVGPGSPRSARIAHWVDAGIFSIYVGFFLVLAALITTVAVSAIPQLTHLNPLAEPSALAFVCLLWAVADFFYKEALLLRSEVKGIPSQP